MSREAYVEKLKAVIDEANAKIDQWEARTRRAQADARIDYESHLSDLRRRRDEARTKLDAVRESGAGAWEDLKQGADDAVTALRDGLRKAASHFGG